MKHFLILSLFFFGCGTQDIQGVKNKVTENWILNGEKEVNFVDDYGIRYTIDVTNWTQHPQNKYHIIEWNFDENYLLAQNDSANFDEKNLYTRIDFMQFKDMEPFIWGYCLTAFDAKSIDSLSMLTNADRDNPKEGCNGYPFSRMKQE